MATKNNPAARWSGKSLEIIMNGAGKGLVAYCYISGDYLTSIGINEGDTVAIQPRDWRGEEDENRLMAFYDPSNSKTVLFGYVFDNFGEVGIIAANGKQWRFKRKKVDFCGEVIAVVKPFDAPPPMQVETNNETQVECSQCEKTGTGDMKFLKAMGWQSGDKSERKPLCLNCDLY